MAEVAHPSPSPGRAPTDQVVYESDWLASQPLFYNVRSGRWSHRINEVIDLADLEFDPEGLNDYLDFGFSVFERTPVRDVRMLRHSSRLMAGPSGLRVIELDDPAEPWLDRQSSVADVIELVRARVNDAARAAGGDVVVPTSGGYDSRFINLLLEDKARVRDFTYGVSDRPGESAEAVKAAELARRLEIRWDLVPLGDFHEYFMAWDDLYGVATHAHGMYHIEFYRHVARQVAAGSLVLSGACGEWFAGDDREVRQVEQVSGVDDVLTLFRYGRMCADSRQSLFKSEQLGVQRLLEAQPRIRSEMLPRVITVVRLRMVLLSYLLAVPSSLGFDARAPFLDQDVALSMLTLPAEQRHERAWQRELFRRHDVDIEAARLPADHRNTLNLRAMRRVPLRPLDVTLLSEIVKPDYVRWINRNVGTLGLAWEVYWRLGWTPGFRRAAKALKRAGVTERRIPAYCAYLTLKPLEELLRRRDRARLDDTGISRRAKDT